MYKTREEIENWLKKMMIKNYVIKEDLTVDVNGDVDISSFELNEINIQFNIIHGSFYCNENKLTNLKGCPKVVNKSFYCSNNVLTSLESCPEIINGDFDCSRNELKSLEGCPEIINGYFYCYDNKITSLESCPKIINGDFYCNNNNELISLKGCPEIINGNFYCYSNKLTSLSYFPKEIKGEFIYMSVNKIKEEELVNFHCDIRNVREIYSDFNNKGNKEEFLGKVNYYKNIKKESELLKELSVNSNNVKLNKKL